MTEAVKPLLQVYPRYENDKGVFDLGALSDALQAAPSEISKSLIWAAGQYLKTDDYAISKLTEGIGNVEYVDTYEYQYPIMSGDLDRMDALAIVNATANAGIGFSPVTLTFKTRHFKFQNTIITPSKVQLRVIRQPRVNGTFWDYDVVLMSGSASSFIPANDLLAGALYERGPSAVEIESSTGVESEEIYPGKAKNMISTLRSSMKFAGHITKFPIKGDSNFSNVEFHIPRSDKVTGKVKTFKYWWNWKEWQHFLKMRKYKEIDFWISEYNKLPDGTIQLTGPSGKVIPRGDGILSQITNRGTYSGVLTASRFESLARELFYGISGAEKKHIQLHTGTGGMAAFNEAMQDKLKTYFTSERTLNTFVTKTGDELQLGKYFTTYKTVDGHTITVHKNPVFDLIYRNSPKYKGLPGFSYEMIFLDMSTYDGQPNVKMVTRKGRELVREVVKGMATMPDGYNTSGSAASDKDEGSVEFLFEQGICIYDISACYRLSLN